MLRSGGVEVVAVVVDVAVVDLVVVVVFVDLKLFDILTSAEESFKLLEK